MTRVQIHSQRAIYYKHGTVDFYLKCHCKHLYPVGRTDGIWWYIEVVLDFNVYIVFGFLFSLCVALESTQPVFRVKNVNVHLAW